MSQNFKMVFAVVITTIVVGGGVYFWKSSEPRYPEVVILPSTEQPASESLTTTTKDSNTQTTENPTSTKTYKSNLYGYSFSYPSKYADKPTYLNNIGMEEITNGNEIFGIQVGTAFHDLGKIDIFSITLLTPNEKLATNGTTATSEEIASELKNNPLKKIYTNNDALRFVNASYNNDLKHLTDLGKSPDEEGLSKTIDSIELNENILTGNRIYQYGYGEIKYMFLTDGYNIYQITYTQDSTFTKSILDTLKFRK